MVVRLIAYISVNKMRLQEFSARAKQIAIITEGIRSDFYNVGNTLDWDVKAEYNIDRIISEINTEMNKYVSLMNKYQAFFDNAYTKYSELDKDQFVDLLNLKPGIMPVISWKPNPGINNILNWFNNNIVPFPKPIPLPILNFRPGIINNIIPFRPLPVINPFINPFRPIPGMNNIFNWFNIIIPKPGPRPIPGFNLTKAAVLFSK